MPARALAFLALALLAAAAVFLLTWTQDEAPAPLTGPDARESSAPADPATATEPRRALEVEPAATEPEPAETATPTLHVRGRVLDITGQPIRDVPVRTVQSETTLGTSDVTGHFEIELAKPSQLFARGNGYAPVRGSAVQRSNAEREHVLVAARALDLGGVVVATGGTPLAEATVEIQIDELALIDIGVPLDMSFTVRHLAATTNAQGRFELTAVPCPTGAELVARCDGYESSRTDVPAHSRNDLYLELEPHVVEPAITGFVLHPDGTPATEARVRFGFHASATQADGSFAIDNVSGVAADMPLVAGKSGYGTAVALNFGETIKAAKPRPPAPITLRLGAQSRDIAGRVVDSSGQPLAGWHVSIAEGTQVTRFQTPPVLVEGFGHGRDWEQTDEDGAFRLVDLLDKPYVLRAYQQRTLLCVLTDPIPAGSHGVEIVVADDLTLPRVKGTVISRRGAPLAKVQVVPGLITHRTEWGSSWQGGEPTVTDERGRFEITDFPREHVHLDVAGESVVPQRFELGPNDDMENLQLSVAQRCHFQVTLTGNVPDKAWVEMWDADGKQLQIYTFHAGGWSSSSLTRPVDGKTPVCAASEDAAELVVKAPGNKEPRARRPVSLEPGRVTELTVGF